MVDPYFTRLRLQTEECFQVLYQFGVIKKYDTANWHGPRKSVNRRDVKWIQLINSFKQVQVNRVWG